MLAVVGMLRRYYEFSVIRPPSASSTITTTMEADDNGSEESASVATPVEPLDDMAPLQQALEDNATEKTKPRHAIVRLWNKEDVE